LNYGRLLVILISLEGILVDPKLSVSEMATLWIPNWLEEVGFKITLVGKTDKKPNVGETDIENNKFSGSYAL